MTVPFKVYNDFESMSYEGALHEVQRLKESGDAGMIYKIVKSGYGDFGIIAIKLDFYVDMLIGKVPYPPGLAPGNAVEYADVE